MGLRYFALKRLSLYDVGGEPLTLEPGDFLPDELASEWGAWGLSTAVEAQKIAPLPASVADLLVAPKPRRVKAAA